MLQERWEELGDAEVGGKVSWAWGWRGGGVRLERFEKLSARRERPDSGTAHSPGDGVERAAHRWKEDQDREGDAVGEYHPFLSWPKKASEWSSEEGTVCNTRLGPRNAMKFYSLVYILSCVKFILWRWPERVNECGLASSESRKIPPLQVS